MRRLEPFLAALLIGGALFGASHETAAQSAAPDEEVELSSRIVYGKPAARGAFPSAVFLIVKHGQDKMSTCGGSVIDSEWILTAAHCVTRPGGQGIMSPDTMAVLSGTNVIDANAGQISRAVEVRVHEGYPLGQKLIRNDVALIRVASPIQAPRQMLASTGAKAELERPDRRAMVVGYGKTETGKTSDVLLRGDVPVVSLPTCSQAWSRLQSASEHFGPFVVCAGSARPGAQDSCNGDSGGPLMVPGASGNLVQIGIVSWGSPDCVSNSRPSVYASVAHFEPWIRKHVPNALFYRTSAPAPGPGTGNRPPVPAPTPPRPDEEVSAAPQLNLDIVQGNTLREGTPATIRLASSIAGHLVVFSIDAAGAVTQIAPNRFSSPTGAGVTRNRLKAGEITLLPGPADGYRLTVSPPAGDSRVIGMVIPPGAGVEDAIGRHVDLQPIPDGVNYIAKLAALANPSGAPLPSPSGPGTIPVPRNVAIANVTYTVVAR